MARVRPSQQGKGAKGPGPKGGKGGCKGGKGGKGGKGAGPAMAAIGAPKTGGGGRARVTQKRVVGQLVTWRGKFGWIRPTEPIDHPKAYDHGGRVYVGVEDVEGQELEQKCMVSFIVYADDNGLGAMHCKRTNAAPPPEKPAKGAAGKGGVIKTNLKQSAARLAPLAKMPLSKGKGKGKAEGKGKVESKGAGKGAGKKGAKAEREEGEDQGPRVPDKTTRVRIMNMRIVGKIVRWRGQIGWIRPVEKIEDPDVPKHRRGIYLHEVDVQKGHEMFQGAQVDFFLYKDEDGVGAEHCRLTKDQPAPSEEPPKPKAAAKGKGKGQGKAGGKPVKQTMVEKEKLRRTRRRGKKAGKGKEANGEKPAKGEKGEKTESGPDLPRERVTDMPVTGEVLVWKGKFGWLRPSEELSHELAQKHDGKIYIHEKDILDGSPLKVGQTVEFHVYADASGLGAEEAIGTSST